MEVGALGDGRGRPYLVWWFPKKAIASAHLWVSDTRASRARPPSERRLPHLLTTKVPHQR